MVDTPLPENLPDMPIPVLSNRWILKLLEMGTINIEPFDSDLLGPTAYRLTPHRMRFHFRDEEDLLIAPEIVHLDADHGRELRPGEYGVISPRERISIAHGFVADFFPSSWCIENKLLVTAGRLDAGYEADLVFGVFNAGRSEILLTSEFQLIRVTFGWLGNQNMPTYAGAPPGAYIPQMEQLRRRETELDEAEKNIRRRRAEISQRKAQLLNRP